MFSFCSHTSRKESSPNCAVTRSLSQNPPLGKNARPDRYLMGMGNPLHPSHMTAPERLAELAEILAAGLMRLRARQSTPLSAHRGESSLDCPGHQSGHADILTDGGSD